MILILDEERNPWSEQSYDLRDRVLRKPLGIRLTEEEKIWKSDEFQLVFIKAEKVVGILLMTPLISKKVKMRQVGVSENEQGRGIGKELVMRAESEAKNRGFRLIELNARQSIAGFYEKLGYTVEGSIFVEVGIPHIKMIKILCED